MRTPSLSEEIDKSFHMKESECIEYLSQYAQLSSSSVDEVKAIASQIIKEIRSNQGKSGKVDALIRQYDLSTKEGVSLMCLAEALLRVPDSETRDDLIADKISSVDWSSHSNSSDSRFVDLSTQALSFTKSLILAGSNTDTNFVVKYLKNITSAASKPIIRKSIAQFMKIMGGHFVLAENIKAGVKKAKANSRYLYSFDMLGEAARTDDAAEKYFLQYQESIIEVGKWCKQEENIHLKSGVSVKLSALDPRYEVLHFDRVMHKLYPKIKDLALEAKLANIPMTIDAEESERLELSLHIFKELCQENELSGWEGLGLAVQAYQKRAFWVIDWLSKLAKLTNRKIPVRLVKGAYWDTEIKRYQELGLEEYPVFTRKCYTDVSYIACAKKLFQHQDCIYPQFATHNANTIGMILQLAGKNKYSYEFQCLHGMGHSIYNIMLDKKITEVPCRIYAPVGNHEDLLSYLIRRLLENGANSSFVNKISDSEVSIDKLVENPIEITKNKFKFSSHSQIMTPPNIYKNRRNSKAMDIDKSKDIQKLHDAVESFVGKHWVFPMFLHGESSKLNEQSSNDVYSPSTNKAIGSVIHASAEQVETAINAAYDAFDDWSNYGFTRRAEILKNIANSIEKNYDELISLLLFEAGKTIANAISEVREAIDFCRYYAQQAEEKFSISTKLEGPTGEDNIYSYTGKGVMVCISPWNFPLAIFLGQVSASLVAGNTVIAKPAEQTPLIASKVVQMCYDAGVPRDVLQLAIGPGKVVGEQLISSDKISGVLFTGSTAVAKHISRKITEHDGQIITLVAETGGQNCMFVDSSALPEQVVHDIIISGFDSAGQRCSALRLLLLQEDIADDVLDMLIGAMDALNIGDSKKFDTDIGPIIDIKAKKELEKHIDRCKKEAKILHRLKTPQNLENSINYFPPALVEIDNIAFLKQEVFGPVIHVLRYKKHNLDTVVEQINKLGYGLTFGSHSRIDSFNLNLQSKVKIGNIYVNRNIIGATVGVQPFGGQGLSGTGPKAGGPMYLHRLTAERLVCTNTAATGGNTELLSLNQDDL